MPSYVHRLPQPRLHRPSGQARVRISGKEYWLGKFGSPAAKEAYDRLIRAYLADNRQPPPTVPVHPTPIPYPPDCSVVTVTVLLADFWEWALRHYRKMDGAPTREADNFRSLLRRMRRRFGNLPVSEFGPVRLLEFRDQLVNEGLARRTINAMIRRLRQVFRWGVSRELVPVEVLTKLQTLEPLQPGRGGRETSGSRGPVEWSLVEQTLPALHPMFQAFVVVAFHTGARRGELARLTTGQIDRTHDVWIANLDQHKTAHKGKPRRILIGPRAQEALEPWLRPEAPDEPIFAPSRIDAAPKKRKRKGVKDTCYVRTSLDQVLRRAIKRAGVEPWTLGQLRHSAAVRITDAADLTAAQQALGHTTVDMTRHYAAAANELALQVVRRIG